MSSKNQKAKVSMFDGLTREFMDSISPVVNALDAKPASRDHAAADTGQASQSTMDVGLRIELGTMLSFYHRQLNGPIITKRGTYPSCKDLIKQNETKLSQIAEEFDNPSLTVTGQIRLQEEMERALGYLKINEARAEHYSNMLNTFGTAYYEITKERWAPPKEVENPAVKTLKNMSESEAAEAKAVAMKSLERFKARKAA